MNKPRPGEDWELCQTTCNWKVLELRQKSKALEAKLLVYSPLTLASAAAAAVDAAATLLQLPPPRLLQEAPWP